MKDRDYAAARYQDWRRLAGIVERAGANRRVLPEDRLALPKLVRHAAADLARLRRSPYDAEAIAWLNVVVGRGRALMQAPGRLRSTVRAIANFYLVEFPAAAQREFKLFALAFLTTAIGVVYAYGVCVHNAHALNVMIPPMFQSSAKAWKSGHVTAQSNAAFSGFLMTHNLTVDLIAGCGGVFGGVPTLGAVFANGATMGAFAALMTRAHAHATFWPGILPHGIAELTALMLCAAGGLVLGRAVLLPKMPSRAESLRLAAPTAMTLMLGTLPLTLFAGLVEGMLSHVNLSHAVRYTFAAINGTLWYLYLFVPRRAGVPAGTEPPPAA
ncbi:MAG: stage II sporulation protein M [Armatimonadetes bacterium]|nr:stage II sporulation protein M [Armatimonadota bacterium]MDE2207010.1 stage II sporulation protein M [Armatimonadota bacterium]